MPVAGYVGTLFEAILGGIFLGVGAPLIVEGFAAANNTSLSTIGGFLVVALGLGLVWQSVTGLGIIHA